MFPKQVALRNYEDIGIPEANSPAPQLGVRWGSLSSELHPQDLLAPKAPPPKTITLCVRFHHVSWGWGAETFIL